MFKEGAYTEEGTNESIEHSGGFSEETIRNFLEKHHTVENSGKNGIILKFSKDELPLEVQKSIDSDPEDNPEGALTVKALKLYALGEAQKEFDALREAREIILKKQNSQNGPFAKIPKASGFYDIQVSEDFQNFLNKNGASIVDGKVGLIMMDYIEGTDLAVLLHRELLKRIPAEQEHYPLNELDNPSFEDMFRALEKSGFVLPEAIATQIKNSMALLHEKEFYHNDLHPRNIIIRDGDMENPQAYIIDFATATHGKRILKDSDIKYLPDGQIISSLASLSKSANQKESDRKKESLDEWNNRIEAFKKQPRGAKQYEVVKIALEGNNLSTIENQFILSSSSDMDLQNFLAILISLSRENAESRTEVIDFLSSHENDKKKRTFFLNQLKEAKKIIEN
jgi:tRNA A-37 threonylcarbamoyl transferase component Bud32